MNRQSLALRKLGQPVEQERGLFGSLERLTRIVQAVGHDERIGDELVAIAPLRPPVLPSDLAGDAH
jgi:hypothetical protein